VVVLLLRTIVPTALVKPIQLNRTAGRTDVSYPLPVPY
jgi:hypothetical protein